MTNRTEGSPLGGILGLGAMIGGMPGVGDWFGDRFLDVTGI
jgi:hypothetical protein